MSLFQLVDYPNYVVCTNKKKVYSLATGKLVEMTPETKSTRSFSFNTVVNGTRKKVFMTFDRIVQCEKKAYGADLSSADIKKTARSAKIDSRYQTLPSPLQNYVYDTFDKEVYSLHGAMKKMLASGGRNNKRWHLSHGVNHESSNVYETDIIEFINQGKTTDFKYKPISEVYYIVINIEVGEVIKERYENAVDASEAARVKTYDTGFQHEIFKRVGTAYIDEKTDKVKVKKLVD